jgi:hypothetical protein
MPRKKLFEEKRIITLKYKVHTSQEDIDNGVCKLTHKCMERIANIRALVEHLGLKDRDEINALHVKVDAGTIRFNYGGYRWEAKTPRTPKNALMIYDDEKRGGKAAVRPHSYTVTAQRTSKVEPFSRERQDQINAARNLRKKAGKPDRVYVGHNIHERIVGYAPGNG